MEKIEIEGKLDRSWVIELLSSGYETYDIVRNYELPEDTILECTDLLDKEVLIQGLNFSEEFVTKAIEMKYLNIEDITELSMTTYSNLSDDFHTKVIEDKNLWSVISANDLSIDFIRQWKDKLDWSYLSMVKCFTDEEKEEFVDYILTPVQKEMPGDLINTDDLKVTDKMSEEELEELIYEISKHLGN